MLIWNRCAQRSGFSHPFHFLLLIGLVLTLAGCGGSAFDSGDRVWLSLEGVAISEAGLFEPYAIGTVIDSKDKMVQVQIEQVTGGLWDGSGQARVGETRYYPVEQVSAWDKGKEIHDRRQAVLAIVARALGIVEGAVTDSELQETEAQARSMGMEDAADALFIVQANNRLVKALGMDGDQGEDFDDAQGIIDEIADTVGRTEAATAVGPQMLGMLEVFKADRSISGRADLIRTFHRLLPESLAGVASVKPMETLFDRRSSLFGGSCGFDPVVQEGQDMSEAKRLLERDETLLKMTLAIASGNGKAKLAGGKTYESVVASAVDNLREKCRLTIQAHLLETHGVRQTQTPEALEDALNQVAAASEKWRWISDRPILDQADIERVTNGETGRFQWRERQRANQWGFIKSQLTVDPDSPGYAQNNVEMLLKFLEEYPEESGEKGDAQAALAKAEATMSALQAAQDQAYSEIQNTVREFLRLAREGSFEEASKLFRDSEQYMNSVRAGWGQGPDSKNVEMPAFGRIVGYRQFAQRPSSKGDTEVLEIMLTPHGGREQKIGFTKRNGSWRVTPWW